MGEISRLQFLKTALYTVLGAGVADASREADPNSNRTKIVTDAYLEQMKKPNNRSANTAAVRADQLREGIREAQKKNRFESMGIGALLGFMAGLYKNWSFNSNIRTIKEADKNHPRLKDPGITRREMMGSVATALGTGALGAVVTPLIVPSVEGETIVNSIDSRKKLPETEREALKAEIDNGNSQRHAVSGGFAAAALGGLVMDDRASRIVHDEAEKAAEEAAKKVADNKEPDEAIAAA